MNDLTSDEIVEINTLALKCEMVRDKLNLALFRLFSPMINVFADIFNELAEAIDSVISTDKEVDARELVFGDTP